VLISSVIITQNHNQRWSGLLTSLVSVKRACKTDWLIFQKLPLTGSVQYEQSCSERSSSTCHYSAAEMRNAGSLSTTPNAFPTTERFIGGRKSQGGFMEPVLRPLRNRVRRRLAFVADLCGKLFAILIPRAPEVRSQRMCPFCGLITPRHKTFCLECGKSLTPA